ncbi:MAG: YicC family protein [Legionella sp.]|nr:MAG: YicC family protein [Legionella sp.]PJD99399.1 MAG: YicC family protein [Legionella sp.]
MIRSMTGFARAQGQFERAQLCWEIRAVNHRYLDVSFRLPESLRFIEPQLRLALKDTVSRGKLECFLRYQDTLIEEQSIPINNNMVNALLECGQQLSIQYQIANDLTVSQVLAWPGVVSAAFSNSEQLSPVAITLFKEALSQLNEHRLEEGKALRAHILSRLDQLSDALNSARAIASLQVGSARERLFARLKSLGEITITENRIEHELALIIARMDVSEELDRLQTHIVEVQKALSHQHSAGRRLDFLMQELNREANTLSSKSDSPELTQLAIEMKVLIEQMREQIQNIE